MASLDEVAQLANGLVAGVNWSELASRGKNSVYSEAYIYDYLIPAADKAGAVMRSIDVGVTDEDMAWQAYKHVYSAVVSQSGNELLRAAAAGKAFLDETGAPGLARDVYRHIIGVAYRSAMYGLSLHLPPVNWRERGLRAIGSIHLSGMSEAEIAQHANLVNSLFSGIAMLDRLHALRPIKRPEFSTNGLGELATATVIVIAGAVVLVSVATCAIIAWFLLALKDTSDKNRAVSEMCARAQASGDPTAIAQCLEVLSNPDNRVANAPFKSAEILGKLGFEQLAKYAFYGLLVYGAVTFAPLIARQIKKTREVTA